MPLQNTVLKSLQSCFKIGDEGVDIKEPTLRPRVLSSRLSIGECTKNGLYFNTKAESLWLET